MNENENSKKIFRVFIQKAFKAVLKGIIFYVIYLLISGILAPISEFIPSFQQMIRTFAIIYITLMIVGELAAGSIAQYFFNGAKALFIIAYMMLTLNSGIYGISFENINLMIDIRFFMLIGIVLGVLSLAKAMLQAIRFLNERAELQLV